MMGLLRWELIVAVSLSSTPCWAGARSADLEDCLGRANTNRDVSACYSTELAQQEGVLQKMWDAAYREVKTDGQESAAALLDEQRKWVSWKESACRYFLNGFGREGIVFQYPECRLGVILDRIEYLKRIAFDTNRGGE